jgi:glucose-1-phosphate cytidylyltransferase
LALGWMGEEIRRYFLEYDAMIADITIDLGSPGTVQYHTAHGEREWRVTCCDTGVDALTGTRIRRAASRHCTGTFMVTYGDGVGNVDINALLRHHYSAGRLATVTAVQPAGRFGELIIESGAVTVFEEKPQVSSGSINGGFMVFEYEALDKYFPANSDFMLETGPLSRLAADGQLTAYLHSGFWQPMDTQRERGLLEELWKSTRAPWRVWD